MDHLVHTMPRDKYESLDPQKKRRLLEAAMKEFGAHGYELASINRILDEAGFSKGSFYYYFDDKLDLAVTVFLVAAEPELKAELATPTSVPEFWSLLRSETMRRLEVLESKTLEYQCLMRLGNAVLTQPALAARVQPHFGPSLARTAMFMQRGVELGALRSDLPVALQMQLIASVKAALYKSRFDGAHVPTHEEMEAFTDELLDLVRRLCCPSPEVK